MANENPQPQTVIVERSGGGAGWIIAIVLIVAVAIGAVYLIGQNRSTTAKIAAMTSATTSVGRAGDKVGGATPGQ